MTESEKKSVPDFDRFDDVAIRVFLKGIPAGESRQITLNHIPFTVNCNDTPQGLFERYKARRQEKQSS